MRLVTMEDLKEGVAIYPPDSKDVLIVSHLDKIEGKVRYDSGLWDYLRDVIGRYLISTNQIGGTHYDLGSDNEAYQLVSSRSNGTYNKISDEATAIINILGESEYSYFFSQLANKMARINNGYSVEDSILDIQGYALLELTKFREKQNEQSN